MSYTYLTTFELAEKIKYKPKTIRDQLVGSVLFEGKHFIKPFGQRRMLFIWEEIEAELKLSNDSVIIPLANGGVCYG
jgi:hypothetical protein